MTEETPASGDASPRVDVRAALVQAVRVSKQHEAEALRLQGQVLAAADHIVMLNAKHARVLEEHEAALTDRDLAHSQAVDRLQAEINRLHQTIRDQGKQSLENEALAHGHAREAREHLAVHVEGSAPKPAGGPPPGTTAIPRPGDTTTVEAN